MTMNKNFFIQYNLAHVVDFGISDSGVLGDWQRAVEKRRGQLASKFDVFEQFGIFLGLVADLLNDNRRLAV